jgi:hypothetical protein
MLDTPPTREPERLATAARAHARRILVVANQTATSAALIEELSARAGRGPLRVHLVVPALNSRLRHWLSDIDDALSVARRRAEETMAVLASRGMTISAEVGDSVPLLAIEDALSEFAADEIVICTLPPTQSHWLEQDLVDRARVRFGVQVSHLVVEERVTPPALRISRSRSRSAGPSAHGATRARARSLRG